MLLNLSNNSIKALHDGAFEGLFKLRHLILSHNKMVEIKSGTFSNLKSLQTLNLANNQLKTLQPNSLPSQLPCASGLQVLDLSNNQIVHLSSNISPAPLRHLRLMLIGNNLLQQLGFENSFIPNAKIVGIDRNRFSCSDFDTMFQSIDLWHFDSIFTRIECNSKDDANELQQTNAIEKEAVESPLF